MISDGEPVEMRHASLLAVHDCGDYLTAEVRNPWDSTRLLRRYVLVDKTKPLPENLPEGDLVKVPLDHSVFFTSVHTSLLEQLGAYGSISGVCDSEYMYLPQLQKDIKAGKIVDCGNSMTPDIEKIINLQPDGIFLSPFENSGSYGKLGKLNIPIIECADYMETSALGRAEWMRFYGLLAGKKAQADSLFAIVETAYDSLATLVKGVKHRPTVFSDKKFGASWYVAGGNSTTGRLLDDAGADYIFKDEKSAGSVPYDPEVVFDRAQQAEKWIVKYNMDGDMTYSILAEEWANYSQFEAFKNGEVYVCNLSKVPFYEETPFHPELLLRDYIIVFHPEVLKDKTPRYFYKLTK